MGASIYLRSADGSGDIRSGEIDGHTTVVEELQESYESGPELSGTDMQALVKEKIRSLIDTNDVSKDDVDPLLDSFIQALHDWQQTSEKVVILLKYSNYVIISHGHHEDGSYYNGDEYEVGERILDTDNIISSAKITRLGDDEYELEYHSRSDSDYFRRYIGLSEMPTDEERVYVTFDYKDNGISTSFSMAESQFSEDDNVSVNSEGCELSIYGDEHPLKKISWGGGTYDGSTTHRLKQFHSDLEKKRQNLHVHDKKIKNINGLIDQVDAGVDIIERESEVLIADSSYQKVSDPVDILSVYATSKYDYIDLEFLDTIVTRVINGSILKLYGPAAGYSTNPFVIPSNSDTPRIEFKSISDNEISQTQSDIIDSLYKDIDERVRDETMARMLTRVLFELVHLSSNKKTEHLQKICDSFVVPQGRTTEHETDVIEYKRELPGNSVGEIVEQMIAESSSTGLKILIWGISEDNKYQITPLKTTPDSDTCRNIEERCRQEASLSEVKIHEMSVDSNGTSGKIILGLMLGDTSESEAIAQVFE